MRKINGGKNGMEHVSNVGLGFTVGTDWGHDGTQSSYSFAVDPFSNVLSE